mmetsp:Transcript_17904/g.22484  ORF Transcript_17904/g.22484 Transcript_17904/m.22484 type:complete len:328 (-) Transcript_17904:550-1533(-)
MLLEGGLHDLSLHADLPDADLTLHATGDDARAVVGGRQGGHTVVVRVIDCVQETAALGEESADLTVVPAGEDAAPVVHELHGEALEAWHLDTEELLARDGVPDADVVDRARSEEVGVAGGERDVVDALVVTCVSKLRLQSVRVGPVDGGLRGAGKEVCGVGRQRDGRARAGNLLLALQLHHLVRDLELGDGAVTGAEQEVAVSEELHAVDTLGEKAVARANALEKAALEVDLNDIASEGSEERAGVIGSDDNALVDALDLSHGHVVVQDLLLRVVDVPNADAVVVNGHKLLARVVEEGDLVGDVHANSVAANGFSTHSLIKRRETSY